MIRLALIAVLVTAAAPAARADRGKAERYFRAGEKAYHSQDFEAAAQEFELAYKELDLPEIAFSAAQAYRRQFRVDPQPRFVQRAVALYQVYLKRVKTGGRVADAADGLSEMERELDKLGAAGRIAGDDGAQTRIGVSVVFADVRDAAIGAVRDEDSREPAARIDATVDGKPWPVDKLAPIEPGEHVVRAQVAGYQPQQRTVKVVAGAPELVELALEPLPAHVAVHTEAGAKISVDGRLAGIAPLAVLAIPAGRHLVTVTARGREPAGRELDLSRAQDARVDVALEQTARRRAVPWVAGASVTLGVVAIASTAGAFYWEHEALGLEHQLHTGGAPRSTLDDYNTEAGRRDDARTIAIVTGSAALATGLAAAWLYYFDRPEAEGVRLVPAAGPQGAGALISGRF